MVEHSTAPEDGDPARSHHRPCIVLSPGQIGSLRSGFGDRPKPLRFASLTLGVRSEAMDGLANHPS
jgi:hypothetical protein